MADRQVYVILGMQRSGTSALARAMSILGVDLGDQLLAPTELNPSGFWEDKEGWRINHQFLEISGSEDWIPGLDSTVLRSSKEYQLLFAQAVRLLEERLGRHPAWAFKEPGTDRLLFFWREVFAKVGAEEKFLFVLRNPLSIADSLISFICLRPMLSYALWLEHSALAIQGTLDRLPVIVGYERLLADPRGQVLRLVEKFNRSEQMRSAELERYADKFLDSSLAHSAYTHNDLALRCRKIPLVIDIYDLLDRRASDQVDDSAFRQQWAALYGRYEVEFPRLLRDNPWMLDPQARQLRRWRRWLLRIRQRKMEEIKRLARRAMVKLAGRR